MIRTNARGQVEIVKSYDPQQTDGKIATGCQSVNFCSWNRLKEVIPHLTAQKTNERLVGVRATEDGLEFLFNS